MHSTQTSQIICFRALVYLFNVNTYLHNIIIVNYFGHNNHPKNLFWLICVLFNSSQHYFIM